MNPNSFLVVSGWYTAALSFSPPQKHSTNITNRKISLKNLPKKLNMQKNNCFVFFWGPFTNFKMFFFSEVPTKKSRTSKKKNTNQDVLIKTWVGIAPSLRSLQFVPPEKRAFSPLGCDEKNPWPPSYEVTTRLSQSCLSSWIEIQFFCCACFCFSKKTLKKKSFERMCCFFWNWGDIFSPIFRHWLGVQKWLFFFLNLAINLLMLIFWWVFSQPSRWILDGFSKNYWCLVSVAHPGCHRGKWRFIRIAD